jgi:hypothetical protein
MQPHVCGKWKVVDHAPTISSRSSPPPSADQYLSRWAQFPAANRQRLLWLLSQLLERQLSSGRLQEEVSHEADAADG